MAHILKTAAWNASGLSQHAQEIKLFLQNFHLDILLVSETHFTERRYMKIPNYNIYHTTHPDETAHGGTAVIIRPNLKHHCNRWGELAFGCESDLTSNRVLNTRKVCVEGQWGKCYDMYKQTLGLLC
jgi:hypothetical protein